LSRSIHLGRLLKDPVLGETCVDLIIENTGEKSVWDSSATSAAAASILN
jgi:hypothetical protein